MVKKIQNLKTFKIIILAVVLLIPVIYSFFYLKSYWDPYGHLQDLKVGIVNLDKGEENKNRGTEFAKELKDSGTMNFVDVESSDKALEGLGEDEYYAIITIPSDFTQNLNSAKTENKKTATITYTPNKRKNYLASQILNSALKTVEIKLESKVSKEVTENLATSLKDVPENLQKISDGADKINNGASSLDEGLQTLSNGVNTLDDKYTQFNNGVASAYEGSKTLSNGTTQVSSGITELQKGSNGLDSGVTQINEALNNADMSKLTDLTNGIATLNAGANQVNDGANSLANGVNSYVDGTEKLAGGVVALDNTLTQTIAYYQQVYALAQDETTRIQAGTAIQTLQTIKEKINSTDNGASLVGGAKALSTADETGLTKGKQIKVGMSNLNSGISQVKAGTDLLNEKTSEIQNLGESIQQLKINLGKVQEGTGKLSSGISTLSAGNTKVEQGATDLSKGLETLNNSSADVKNALEKLNNGTKTAKEGSKKLLDGTTEFKEQISNGVETAKEEVKKLDGLNEFVEDPVTFEEKSYGEVDSYGVAFAPLFISIGLWVGALMCYVVLYYDQRHRFGILDHDTKQSKILQNIIYLGLGAVMGIITGLVLKAGLGYSVTNMATYIWQCILAGMVFMSVIQLLIRNFGDIGKFIALIILVLQLAASGGTFPVETIDNGFKVFTNILPMTYTIKAFKDVLISTDHSLLATNTGVLIGILLVVTIINIITEIIKDSKAKENKEA